jgi:hypothetical protein
MLLMGLCLAVSVEAAPVVQELERNVNLALGAKTFGDPDNGQTPLAIPDDLVVCSLSFDRSQWINPSAVLRFRIWVSYDGGKTWPDWWQGTADGRPAGDTSMIFMHLKPGTGRLARADYDVTGARFRTTVTLRCD